MFNVDKNFLKKITLLYVEDDLDIAEEIYELLDGEFLDIYMAHDGVEGLELFKKQKSDIVLTDIQMPKMNGIEMTKKIREISPEVPIIISSAFSDTFYFKKAIDIGVSGYIIKPIKFDNLINSFDKVLQILYNRYQLEDKSQELIIEKDKLQSALKIKSEFLANMSHEIRTPLNAILGFVDLLKDECKDEKPSEYLNIIDSSSKSLLQIIEDILDFSKIESGKLEIDKVDFNTRAEFETVTYLFMAKASEKNISLVLNLDSTLPETINTDPLRVKQVISNLLSNAIKFTPPNKKIFVDISYKENRLHVSVKDEGKGIAKDKLSYIFESFSQEDSSTTREFGGTGLGLTISTALVKLLGGELKVKSEVGVGSEFYFSIPVTIGKDITKTSQKTKNISFKDKKILLVEDNKANQMFMKVVLKKMKLKFDIANDGVEAVEMFKNNRYDTILMDENMPNMGGIEATKRILEIEREQNLPHTPIIALTANALKGDRERFLVAGMDEYITKPLDKKRLSKVMGNFLK